MTRFRMGLGFVAALAGVAAPPLYAATIVVEGSAPLEGGSRAAREHAMQDALRMAALSQGVAARPGEDARSLPGKVKVLDEGERFGSYFVRLRVQTRTDTPQCAASERLMRRRLLTTYFQVERPVDASDLNDLATSLPQELARRLQRHPPFKVMAMGSMSVIDVGVLHEAGAGMTNARELARRANAQLVVAGKVVSTMVTARGLRAAVFESNTIPEPQTAYDGPFSKFLGGAFRRTPSERQFELEFWVYDGLSGAIVAEERIGDLAHGDVQPTSPPPFASAAFWQTDYGRLVDDVLTRVEHRIAEVADCTPFATRVLQVDGEQVTLDAGAADGLQVGDHLLVYRQAARVSQSLDTGFKLGQEEELAGELVVNQVQAGKAVGSMGAEPVPVEAGDYARLVVPAP